MKTSLVRIKISFFRLSNISPQLVLAVATYVSAEADAQIPLALMPGFRFSPVSPPLVYHRSPVHFYKAEQIEESDEKMEERLRIAQHEGADRPMPGPKVSSKEAPTPYKKDGFTSKIVAQPFGNDVIGLYIVFWIPLFLINALPWKDFRRRAMRK